MIARRHHKNDAVKRPAELFEGPGRVDYKDQIVGEIVWPFEKKGLIYKTDARPPNDKGFQVYGLEKKERPVSSPCDDNEYCQRLESYRKRSTGLTLFLETSQTLGPVNQARAAQADSVRPKSSGHTRRSGVQIYGTV